MNIIRKAFTAKHGEVFSILIAVSFIQGISKGFSDILDIVFYTLYIIFYIGWLLLLGTGLKSIRSKVAMNYNLFLVTGFLLSLVVIVVKILGTIGLFDNVDNNVIVITMLTFIIISLIVLSSFIAKNLKILEKGVDIDINDYFGDIFLLIFWPIGIWNIQSRINRVADRLASR